MSLAIEAFFCLPVVCIRYAVTKTEVPLRSEAAEYLQTLGRKSKGGGEGEGNRECGAPSFPYVTRGGIFLVVSGIQNV